MRTLQNLLLTLLALSFFTSCQKEIIEKSDACVTPAYQNACPVYESAYAKGRYVFASDPKAIPPYAISLNLTKNKWGWAINLGEEEKGTTYYKVFAGAALNDISKGEYVAAVKIDYDGSKVVITYSLLYDSPYSVSMIDIYANDKKPKYVIPGLFGYPIFGNPVDRAYTKTINVKDTDNDGVWIIVHSVVYK